LIATAHVSNIEDHLTREADRFSGRSPIDLERNLPMNDLKTILNRGAAALTSRKTKCAAAAIICVFGTMLSVSDASAFTCARGVYRAGCISSRGAIGFSRNGAVAVGRYGNVYSYRRGSNCIWRNGQQVCI